VVIIPSLYEGISVYIYEHDEWPDFRWDRLRVADLLAEVRHRQGLLLGHMRALGFAVREEATLQTLTQDVLKSSEIEGERLDTEQVRSSIARRLGIPVGDDSAVDRNVEGLVEMMLDATRHYARPLDEERLAGWHAALFPTGRSGLTRITIGTWRNEASDPMQVVSGAYGRQRVHYEALPAARLPDEMSRFLRWFEEEPDTDPVIRAALAHFWFVTIHPFDDGNGRIARALADMALARAEQSGQRFYSMSAQIQRERREYYAVLERCQKGPLDITPWIEWFLHCLERAIRASATMLAVILRKARFWETHAGEPFNARQRKIINLLLDGFEGKLTSSKWATLGKCSQPTAQRDIADLVGRAILARGSAGGRSTDYVLAGVG